MDPDEVDPVVRRLQDWAESPISKEIVSHRNSSVSINDAVEEGKIILVRNTVSNEEVKRVVSTAIIRRVWATIQSRAEEEEEEDREPFFTLIDEFDDVVSEDMNIKKMLTKARPKNVGVSGLSEPRPDRRRPRGDSQTDLFEYGHDGLVRCSRT